MKVIIACIQWSSWVAGVMYCPGNRRVTARLETRRSSVLPRAREGYIPCYHTSYLRVG
jgi:hypothetical protein